MPNGKYWNLNNKEMPIITEREIMGFLARKDNFFSINPIGGALELFSLAN